VFLLCDCHAVDRVMLEQATVLGLVEEAGVVRGVRYRTGDGVEQEAKAPLTFVCDGCFSNLRRKLCEPKVCLFLIASNVSLSDYVDAVEMGCIVTEIGLCS
jgi:2-polyprenyl-6-methoxyphenol hydroxylase-like FAD-dependent oxidoreductase